MQTIVKILVAFVREIAVSRATVRLENIALRQQVAVLKRERPRPRLHSLDRVFWVFLSRLWPRWKDAPEGRSVQPCSTGKIVAFPQVGGLHHRVERLAA